MRSLYTALFYFLVPLITVRLLWRSIKAPAYRRRIPERFGFYGEVRPSEPIWLHAVSVGEAEAAFPLVRALMESCPGSGFLVTTTTPTGSARVRDVLGDAAQHVYLPYDLPDAIGRFLNAFEPRAALIMETEIWPNLYRAIADRKIPLTIINGRLSERSARGYARLAKLTRSSLEGVTWIAAQSEADAKRFRSLGAKADRVEAVGNIKFDMQMPPDLEVQSVRLRSELFGDRPIIIAGSTHDGEEQMLIGAAQNLWATYPDLVLIIAPRHPERFSVVMDLCRRQGLPVVRRSDATAAGDSRIFLLDTMGELRRFYGLSDVAFVGGSLIPRGGHNLLEPAALGIPVIFGPHMFNFREMSRGILEFGAGIQVADVQELSETFARLLGDGAARAAMAEQGRDFVRRGRGALRRVVEQLTQLMERASA